MRSTDPSRMTAEARLAELGDILAAGFQRISAANIKQNNLCEHAADPLDASGDAMAPCGDPEEVPA